MPEVVKVFDAISIKNSSVQIKDGNTIKPGEKFGSVGSISGETVMRELIKRAEGVEVRKRTKPERHDITVSAHIYLTVMRELFGITSENLKPGIYSYGVDAKGSEFIYTADVIDEFEEVTKLIAFPNCISATGFKFTVSNGADEVAEMELNLTAYPDEHGQLYYEALTSELAGESIAEQWHKQFTRDLVAATENPGGVEG
ncbi:hypothetical protein BTS2_0536 [Bacillus sp. TS-2]|nr:hypothetical protein BTS2_0536 [Bacillus sp. TS-2]